MKLAAGIDIGGTNTVIGLVDESGKIHCTDSFRTQEHKDHIKYIDEISKRINDLVSNEKDIELIGIGIGAPTANSITGSIEFSANMPWEAEVKMIELFKNHFDLPVILANDANAAAIGEMIFGKAKGMNDFLMITLGTGVGSGIVSNGELVIGHDSYAGEIGHVIVEINGRECGCGRKGCLETYSSVTGIKRTVEGYLNSGVASEISNEGEISGKAIHDAARNGDQLALLAFDITSQYLGFALANSVAHTSPQAIFLFGGLANAEEFILESTKKYMEESLLHIYKDKVKLEISGLNETNAAILGASALVWKNN